MGFSFSLLHATIAADAETVLLLAIVVLLVDDDDLVVVFVKVSSPSSLDVVVDEGRTMW